MALFNKIRQLFSKTKYELEFSDLENFLDTSVSSKLQELDEKVKDKLQELEHFIQDANESMDVLSSAKLKNEKIEEKLKNYMTGNRDNFIRQVKQLIDWIEIPKSDSALEWCNSFIEKVNIFNESSKKSYLILQEFFADESSKVASALKKINNNVEEIRNLLSGEEIQRINNVRENIRKLNGLIARKDYLSKQIDELNEKKNDIEQSKLKKESEIKRLEQSDSFANHERRIIELKDTNKKIKHIDDSLTQLFSPLRRAMKKYSRVGMNNLDLIDSYSDPLNGLMKDLRYRILELLKALRISIMKNEIELDDKDKVIKKINEITKDKLEAYYLGFKHLSENKERIEKVISNDPTMYQLKEANNALENLSSQLASVNNSINAIKDEFNTINLNELKFLIQKELSLISDSEVTVL